VEIVPKPKVLGVDVTFLANEGFLLESGRYSVLIDSFLREPVDIYAGLPEETYKQLVQAKPPFDGLTIVLVSHDHPDHVQMRGLEKYLGNNNKAQLMTSPAVLLALRKSARDFEAIQKRITPFYSSPGAINGIQQEEMSIRYFQLDHGGKANADVVNLAHLIELGGLKILHVGDAAPTDENFARYDLDAKEIDIAIVPYWFFSSAEAARVLHEEIRARVVIACHIPPQEMAKLSELMAAQFPDVVLFQSVMEKRHFEPQGLPPRPEKPQPQPGQPGGK
jgi:L-ascorbate metabolism protein UlaG (beta-lactamase superfamily)